MSRLRIIADRHLSSLKGLLLTCLVMSCSVPDGVMLNIHVPSGTKVKSYVIKVQDRSSRKVVFLSGLQLLAGGRDLSAEPLRVAMPFNQRGSFLLQVLAANVDNVEALPQQGVTEPQLFFAKILDVSVLQELDVPLLPVAPEYDTDGDHFPDAVRWLAAVPEAMAMYQGTPEVLDCVDGDPPAGDISPVRTRGFDIHPLAQPKCNVMLRAAHPPTATVLPPLAPLDITCAGQPRACVDTDGDGDPEDTDCDDNDKNRFHGNPRPRNCCVCSDTASCSTNHTKLADLSLCNPKRCDTAYDYDCTGLNVPCFIDDDCDGFSANNPDPTLRDCDDTDPRVYPKAPKICDPLDGVIKDWACDGRPQAGCVPCDLDGDGYQRADTIVTPSGTQTCPTSHYAAVGRPLDCDDNDRGVFPGALTFEGTALVAKYGSLDQTSRGFNVLSAMRGLCRNVDAAGAPQNTGCENDMTTRRLGCPASACDKDGDGYPANVVGCMVIGKPVDCNDNDATAFPGAPLHCDGKDHDCDGAIDVCSFDRDADGYDASGDCDDTKADVHPFAAELCNGRDDDCDGLIDELNPDPAGNLLVQKGTNGNTQVTTCADSSVGLCGKQTNGLYSGRCVCTSVSPTSTKDANPANIVQCPGENDASAFTPRCFGANQPQPQTCDADNPVDDDCNGDINDLTGKNLANKGGKCGDTVTANGAPCRKGTIVGCDRSRNNPFVTFGVTGSFSVHANLYLVCTGQTDPVAEKCNGYDDDCNGVLSGETSTDNDGVLPCTGCTNVTDAALFNPLYLGCNDCDDNDPTVYGPPGMGAAHATGADELCDGKDNKCQSGHPIGTHDNEGADDCGHVTYGHLTQTSCCPSMPPMCIDPLTNFSYCGGCNNACSNTTADRCSGGLCMCKADAMCNTVDKSKPLCLPNSGCVQCISDQNCPLTVNGVTTGSACNPQTHSCVECIGNGNCTGNPNGPVCDVTSNRCVPCLANPNTSCTTAGKTACLINKTDNTQNVCVQCVSGFGCSPVSTTPACDLKTNTCVVCTSNTDCANQPLTPACDTNTEQCVPCVMDTDCKVTGLKHCKPGPGNDTTQNSCVQCQLDKDCTTACDMSVNMCAPCAGTKGCAPGMVCLAGATLIMNQCVQCMGDSDCKNVAGKPSCEMTSHTCVACQGDADCKNVPNKTACNIVTPANPAANSCVPCTSTYGCDPASAKPACSTVPANPAMNVCVHCLGDSDCANVTGKTACNIAVPADPTMNQCVPCTGTYGCDPKSMKPVCSPYPADPTQNVCVACLGNGDCQTAPNMKCLLHTDVTMNSCVECLGADCPGTMTCTNNMCM